MSAPSTRSAHVLCDTSAPRSPRSPSPGATPTQDGSRHQLLTLLALLALYVPTYVIYFSSGAPFSLAHAAAACGGRPVLDTRWSYTAADVHDYLVACGPVGRTAVLHQQVGDLAYVALYAGVLLAAYAYLMRAARLTGRRRRLLLALPLIVAGLDYLENAGIWSLLIRYPDPGVLTDRLWLVTATKLTLGYLSFAVLAVLAVTAITNRLHQHRQPAILDRS